MCYNWLSHALPAILLPPWCLRRAAPHSRRVAHLRGGRNRQYHRRPPLRGLLREGHLGRGDRQRRGDQYAHGGSVPGSEGVPGVDADSATALPRRHGHRLLPLVPPHRFHARPPRYAAAQRPRARPRAVGHHGERRADGPARIHRAVPGAAYRAALGGQFGRSLLPPPTRRSCRADNGSRLRALLQRHQRSLGRAARAQRQPRSLRRQVLADRQRNLAVRGPALERAQPRRPGLGGRVHRRLRAGHEGGRSRYRADRGRGGRPGPGNHAARGGAGGVPNLSRLHPLGHSRHPAGHHPGGGGHAAPRRGVAGTGGRAAHRPRQRPLGAARLGAR